MIRLRATTRDGGDIIINPKKLISGRSAIFHESTTYSISGQPSKISRTSLSNM